MKNPDIRDSREIMRDEMVVRDKIVALLCDGAKTIPQIAESLECTSYEVVFWVMAMCRYGTLVPVGKPGADGYYQYQLTQQETVLSDQVRRNHG